jgi:hypothetical protein
MELIKIDTDHFVVVNNSEIKEGDWYIDDIKSIRQSIISDQSYWSKRKEYKKITHSTQPLNTKFNDWFDAQIITLQEVKELLGEVDVEKKVKEYYEKDTTLNNPSSFKAGYNQALEDNKEKRYTEEDLKYMFECGRNYQNNAEITFKVSFEYLPQTKTSWQVEIVDGKLKLK